MLHFGHQCVHVGIWHAHVVRHLVIIDEDLLQVAQALGNRFKYGVRGIQLWLLRYIHYACIGRAPHCTVIQLDRARDGFEQARLSRTVASNESYALACVQLKSRVIEQGVVTKGKAGVIERDVRHIRELI